MRLLITTDTVGGVWTFTRELTEGLLQAGCAVSLVSFGRLPSVDQMAWVERTSHLWPGRFVLHATEFPLEWMQANDGFYHESAKLLERTAEAFGADLVHSNQLCYGALSCGVPVLVTVHSDVRSWFQSCRGAPPESSPWMERYDRLVERGLRTADAVVAPTEWMLEQAREQYGPFRRSAAIPNGRSVSSSPGDAVRIQQAVTAGRVWDEGKGLDLLGGLSAPMPVLVAGERSSPDMEGAACMTDVVYLGRLTEAEVLSLFRRSTIYVVPSRYEPFGLTPVEAALCGCVIVARDLASLREVWGEAALYFSNAQELTGILRSLDTDDGLLAGMVSRARQRALGYSRQAMTELYLAQYHALSGACGVDRGLALDVA